MVVSRVTRAARVGTLGCFVLNGVVVSTWAVHIPVLTRRAGVSAGTLGWLLVVFGASAVAGMQVAGPLTDRWGPRRMVPASAVVCGAALLPVAWAGSRWALAAALVGLGFGNGCMDVSMNTHAVAVERAYGRPVMASFHAAWSLAGVVTSVAGAWTIGRGWPPARGFAIVAGVVVLAAAPLGRLLLAVPAGGPAAGVGGGPRSAGPGRRRVLWLLAGTAFAVMLCEGVAYDWSATHARTVLHASASAAALAYGAFATAATVGRLSTDRVAARVGPVAVVRYGAALAAAGLVLVALAGSLGLALTAWVLLGLGLSGCVPQLFTAAGGLDPAAAGANMARVAGLGYLGMLAGPAVIGGLTHVGALNTAFLVPAVLCAGAAVAGSVALAATVPAPVPVEKEPEPV